MNQENKGVKSNEVCKLCLHQECVCKKEWIENENATIPQSLEEKGEEKISIKSELSRFHDLMKRSWKMYLLTRKITQEIHEFNDKQIEQGKIKITQMVEELDDILSKRYG